MRLVYNKYGLNIELKENHVINIALENATAFSDMVYNLWTQTNGQEGEIILSDNDKVIPFSKDAVFVSNPYSVDCNEKRIITKLHKEITENVTQNFVLEYSTINMQLLSFIDSILSSLPYNLTSDIDLDVLGILKLYNVKVQSDSNNLLDLLINYLKALKSICDIQIIFVLNLKHFFEREQLKELYLFCFYEKIYLINIEGQKLYHLEHDKYYILDKDLCLLDI